MAEQYDGFLRLKTLIDTKDASSQFLKLEASAEKLKRSIELLSQKKKDLENLKIPTEGFKDAQEKLKGAESELKKFTDQIKMYQDMGLPTDVITQYSQGFKEAQQAVKDLRAEIKKMQEEGRAYTSGADANPVQYADINNQIAQQENQLQAVYARERELSAANQAKMVSAISATVNKALSIIKGAVIKAGKILTSFISKMINVFGEAGQALAEHLSGPLKAFAIQGKSGLDVVEKLNKRLWGLVKRVFFFSVITKLLRNFRTGLSDALKDWVKLDEKTNKTISDLKNAFQGWQNEIVTAFAPIINIILPALTKGIEQVTEATRIFGQFVSSMTGTDIYERMKTDAEDYAESLDDVGKSSKKAAKGLASFDKLDVLNGASDTDGAKKQIEEVKDEVRELADLVKNGKFYEVGQIISKRMEESLRNIDWAPIKSRAEEAGRNFGNLINGIFDNGGLAEQAGRNVAEGINTIAGALDGFFAHFRGRNIGNFVSDLFNGVTRGIEFEKIKKAITDGGNEVLAVYRKFWENMRESASNIGKGASDIFNGVFANIDLTQLTQGFKEKIHDLNNLINTFVSGVDWEGAAKNISAAIGNLINGQIIDENGQIKNVWAENGKAVGRIITHFVGTIGDIIANTDFEQLGQDIGTWLNNAFSNIDPKKLAQGISKLVKGVLNMIANIFDTLDSKGFGKGIEEFLSNIDTEGIKQSLGNVLAQIFQFISETLTNSPALQSTIGTVLGILAQTVLLKIAMFINPLAAAITALLLAVADILSPKIFAIFDDIFGTAVEIAMQVLSPLKELIDWIMDGVKSIGGASPQVQAPAWNQTPGFSTNNYIYGRQQQPTMQASISQSDLKQAFSDALAEQNAQQGQQNIVLEINGQQLANATVNDNISAFKRSGINGNAFTI